MTDVPKKKAAPKKPAAHPTYKEMVVAAIGSLKEKKGSSRQAILKYIEANYKVSENVRNHLNRALTRSVKSGVLSQPKGTGASGSFKVVVKAKNTVAKKPVAKKAKKAKKVKKAKKSAAKKPAAKKPAAKKAKKSAPKKAKKPAAKKPAAKKAPKKKNPKKKAAKKAAKKPAAKK